MTKVNQTNKWEDIKRIEKLCDDANKELENVLRSLVHDSDLIDDNLDYDNVDRLFAIPSLDYQGVDLINNEVVYDLCDTIFELQHLLRSMVSSFQYDTSMDTISDEFVRVSIKFVDKSFKLYNTLLRLVSGIEDDRNERLYYSIESSSALLVLDKELKYQFDSTRQQLNLNQDELGKFYQSIDWMDKLMQTVNQYKGKVDNYSMETDDAPDFDNKSLQWYGFVIDEHNSVVNLARINC